nr:hypothetical protein [Sphaerisporangium perillae]
MNRIAAPAGVRAVQQSTSSGFWFRIWAGAYELGEGVRRRWVEHGHPVTVLERQSYAAGLRLLPEADVLEAGSA